MTERTLITKGGGKSAKGKCLINWREPCKVFPETSLLQSEQPQLSQSVFIGEVPLLVCIHPLLWWSAVT